MSSKINNPVLLVTAFSLVASVSVMAQSNQPVQHDDRHPTKTHPGPSRSAGPHGGSIRQTNGIQVEAVVTHRGIQLFAYDPVGKAILVDSGRGVASVRAEGNAKRYRYDLLPDGKGGLTATVSLSKFAGRKVNVDFRLVGLPDAVGHVAFQTSMRVPKSETPRPTSVTTVTTPAETDLALILKQANCPVMDEPLGSMGQPVKVLVGDKPIFLCCKGCVKKVEAEPKKYLTVVYGKPKPMQAEQSAEASVTLARGQEVRAGVFKVTAADEPYITAQKRCPVMDEPLKAMGGPFRVSANGKAIYICCPGCAKKITADPKKYLAVLQQQGVNAPKFP